MFTTDAPGVGANTKQVGGNHYKDVEYQHWDLCWDLRLQHLPAAITKYVTRHKKKDGRQGLEKAVHYAQKYQEVIAYMEVPFPRAYDDFSEKEGFRCVYGPIVAAYVQGQVLRYCRANNLDAEESLIVSLLCNPHDRNGVAAVEQLLEAIIASDYPDIGQQTAQPHYPPNTDETGEEGIPAWRGGKSEWPFPPRTVERPDNLSSLSDAYRPRTSKHHDGTGGTGD